MKLKISMISSQIVGMPKVMQDNAVYKPKLVKNHISMSLLYFSDSCMLNYAAYEMYVVRQILTNLKFMRKKNAKEIKQKCKEICGN